MSLVERIKMVATERGLTLAEIAEKTGVGKKSIYKWDVSDPSISKVVAVSNLLQVSLSWLATGHDESSSPYNTLIDQYCKLSDEDQKMIQHIIEVCLKAQKASQTLSYVNTKNNNSIVSEPSVPYGIESSGRPIAVLGYVAAGKPIEGISVPLDYINSPVQADYALIAKGNSMEPVIMNGEYIYIKNQSNLETGDIGIFYIDGEVTCKLYQPEPTCIILRSLNPDFKPFKYSLNNFHEFRIQGKVILTSGQKSRLLSE